MGARFPGADGALRLWRLLCDGGDAIGEMPASRIDCAALGLPRHAGILDGIDHFDARFFGISPREAQRMDPQQRLTLEVAWEALEDAGQPPLALRGTATGVFLGVHRDEYAPPMQPDLMSATGASRSGVAGRVSYVLGLEGPSLALDTDRSSSLVAVQLACQSLRRGECELALAGGINVLLTPELSVAFARAGMLARDGRIKFCDARADGIVRSDGVGVVVLKSLAAARRDGDRVYAVVLGGAINHDGGRSGDLMTPSAASQAGLLRAACADARVSPDAVQYVEAHGTGTVVGDPVEVAAVAEVLQRDRGERPAVRIGSIKTNIGHTEAAAGIAGLIKVALAVKHRRLPASTHFTAPNPRIQFDGVLVQAATTAWPDDARPLVAGVTSLGLTGTNAHVLVGEAPPPAVSESLEMDTYVLPVSARGREALVANVRAYVELLRSDDAPELDAVARSAALRRSHLEDRVAVVGRTRDEIVAALERWLATGVVASHELATPYMAGDVIEWPALYPGTAPVLDLPLYAWQRERYWRQDDVPTSAVRPVVDGGSARDVVIRELVRALGVGDASAIDLRRPFRELGVTSFLGMELVARLGNAVLGRPLPSSVIFDYPDVAALVAHLDAAERTPSVAPVVRAAPTREPIAVIGTSCRFPGGAADPERYWHVLRDGVDAISEVPRARWNVDDWYDPEPGQPGKMRTRWGGFVDDIDRFDAAFFGISPREAEEMDPQQRLLLEVTWDALERAGLPADRLLGTPAGVFLGLMNHNDYASRKRLHDDPSRIRAHHGTGTAMSVAAGRLAYLLGATGPALVVDTACSSSLVAVHLAMQSLRDGSCRVALAGGVNAILSPEASVVYSQAGMLSPTGRCRTFDAAADGYVRSEGCGIVVLKRLSDAIADGDRVRAVLLGAAVNQDGRSAGLTAPNGQAQRAVIRAALADAGVTPAEVDYVEAHGTGTRLGDPIEVQSLGDVFRDRAGGAPLYVGSAKASVGHLEAAAGVAGLLKVILAIEHGELPPQLHLHERNPLLAVDALPIELLTKRTPWGGGRRRVAGVSSFGMSGTNVHVIVAEPPTAVAHAATPDRDAELVVLSARSDVALAELAGRHAAFLALHHDVGLGDVAHTVATTRSHHDQRLAIVTGDRAELYDALARVARGELPARAVRGDASVDGKRAWLFTGQGAQWAGMGRELAVAEPMFARAIEEIAAALDAHLPRPLLDVMWAEPGSADAALLDQTGFTQPALFAIEVALARLWRAWGAAPDFVAGHSVGEIAAAHVAGVFSLEDAARLVAARARLMQTLPAGGAMYAIAASEADVATWVAPESDAVSIAGVNGPTSVVIAGEETRVAAIADRFARRGVRTSRLTVSHAFHSPLMEPMLGPFRAIAETVRYARPTVPGAGNVDGRLWGAEVATADYWVRHVRAPVRFADGARALAQAGVRTFVELGPRPTLLSMVPADAATRIAVMRPDRPATSALEALGSWYAGGGSVDWNSVMPGPHRRVDLPTYPWQRQRYWISPPPAKATTRDARVLSVEEVPWLADHRVAGEVVVPAAAMVEWMRAEVERVAGRDAELRSFVVRAPLAIADGESRTVDAVVTADERGARRVVLQSRHDASAPWVVHAEAEVHAGGEVGAFDLAAARVRCADRGDVDALYAALADVGLDYGPAFRGVAELWRGDRDVLARVAVPAGWVDDYGAHPAIVDAALQLAVANAGGLYLPFACERVRVITLGAGAAWVSVRFTGERGRDTIGADITIADDRGHVIVELAGFRARRSAKLATSRANDAVAKDALWRLVWRPGSETDNADAVPRGTIAVVGDGLAAEVAAALAARGVRCAHVGDDLDGVEAPDHIVCVWDGDTSPAGAMRVCARALALTKTILDRSLSSRVWWVTRGGAPVAAGETTDPAASSLLGLGRTVQLEHPELGLRLVDVPADSDGAAIDAAIIELATARFDELRDERAPDVAWRGGRRHVGHIEAAPLGSSAPRSLRTDGTVIVTGGLGGVGAHVARVLARRGVAHLVLVGRRGDATPGALGLADELRAIGSDVTIVAADVADRDAVAAMVASVPTSRPLRGVMHAAGLVDDGVIRELTADRLEAVFSPKAAGASHLDELTRDHDLDIFVLFSSVAGTFGSPGQGSYAAANAYLDGLAAARRAQGLPAQSLAWGPWDRVGMSVALDAAQRQRWARRGFRALVTERALALFEQALDRDDTHLVIAPIERAASTTTADKPAHAALPRASAPTTGASSLAIVRAEVARLLALGGPDEVAPERALASLGLDSLMALELRNALGKRVGASLPTTLAFDHPTPAAIARFLDGTSRASAAPPAAATVAAARTADEPIAIIGYGCRFPGGVDDPASFWRLLADGVDAIEEHPRDRWDVDAFYDPDPATPGKTYTREGGFLRGLDQFDAEFFEINPREAADMDPQQRLLLETGWEALERAGIAPASLMDRNVGVFVGVMSHEYLALQGADLERRDGYVTTGSLGSVASGRLSYALGVRGPSMTIDTACSSSLVATHLACQALRAGECELALAGGATVVLTPSLFVEFSRLRGLSRDGRCKSFAAGADGVIWAEGCGVLALKRLADARRDGDRVLAVIAGSAVNQDGRSQGLTAPSGPAQEDVIRRALAQAHVAPADVDYVEAHGTGTKLGDPIEMRALGAVLREGRDPQTPVVVGSFKSNIGHAQAAAGVGGIIKTVLALQHELIPQSLHFDAPSPHIPWDELPVRVAAAAEPWPRRGERKRIAGVSSFGISGTNAHVILEEAPADIAAPAPPRAAEMLVVSARTDAALAKAASELAGFVRVHGELGLGDIATTLARGREHHRHRLAIVATSRDQAARALDVVARGETLPRGARRGVARADVAPLAWMFTGQGSQWAGMGRGLAADWPVFRDAFDRCAAAFDAHVPRRLADVMWATPGSADAALLDQTGFTQPALFAYEVALAALWRSWGLQPSVLVGHSIGEIAAAHVAGVFSLDDAVRLVAARGRLMQALPAGGAMAAIAAPESAVAAAVAEHAAVVSIAAVNAPESIVISGAGDAVERIAADFAARGVRTTRLVVSHAFHSPLMDPMLDAFRAVAASVTYHAPALPLVSNVSGVLAGDEILDADYWVQHVRGAVRFAAGARAAHEAGARAFVEIGPRPILSGLVAGCLPSAPRSSNDPESAALLDTLGALHVDGASIDWRAVYGGRAAPADLPTYPWQRRRYWIEPRRDAANQHPFLLASIARPDGQEHCFTAELSRARAAWLGDHVVHGSTLFPGTGLVELLLTAGRRLGVDAVRELTIEAPLVVPTRGALAVQIWIQGAGRATVYSRAADADDAVAWTRHATAVLASSSPASSSTALGAWPPAAEPRDTRDLYERLESIGLQYGPSFRGVTAMWRGADAIHATVDLVGTEDATPFAFHPALLDAALHPIAAELAPSGAALVPFAWHDIELHAAGARHLRVTIRLLEHGGETVRVTLEGRDGSGQLVFRIGELLLLRAAAARTLRRDAPLFAVRWEPSFVRPGSLVGTAVLGGGGALAERLGLPRFLDVRALFAAGDAPPPLLLVDATGELAGDLVAQTHAATHHALAILQACLADERLDATELVWVTQGAISATPGDAVPALARAPVWGLIKSARREHSRRRLRLLDIEATTDAIRIRDALSISNESDLALRGGDLLVPRLQPFAPARAPTDTWRASGTVLVTGATGALGKHVARHLVEVHGARRLILVSRQGASAPGASALREELVARSADVTFAACDTSRRDQLSALLGAIRSDSPLCAVFHCAGVVDDGIVTSLDPARIDRVLAAKVDAAVYLDELTRARRTPLERFVLFSSVAGIMGTAGQASYAAANAFLDAIAARRAHDGLAAQSLAWGLWESSSDGMGAKLGDADLARLRRQGITPLSVEDGLALLDRCLAYPEPLLVPARLDLAATKRAAPLRAAATETATLAPAKPRTAADVLDIVRTEIAGVFRLPTQSVSDEQPLRTLGLDSLMAIELRDRLVARLETSLPASLAFDHPATADIARHVTQLLFGEPAQPSAPAEPPPPSTLDELSNEELVRLVRSL